MPPPDGQVFDTTRQYMALLDRDGSIIRVNETILEDSRADKDEFVGEKIWNGYWIEMFPQVREQLKEDVQRASTGEFVRHDLQLETPDRTIVLDFSVQPLAADTGSVTYLLAEGRDITTLVTRGLVSSDIAVHLNASLVVSYSVPPEENMSTAVVQSFRVADVDVNSRETTLHDWITPEALDEFRFDLHLNQLTMVVWDHIVVATGETIDIYEKPGELSSQ